MSVDCGNCATEVISIGLGVLGIVGAVATLGPGAALFWSCASFASGEISIIAAFD